MQWITFWPQPLVDRQVIGMMKLGGLSRGRGFQVRIEHRELCVEIGLDLGELNLALGSDLEMDRLVLGVLLHELRLVRGGCGIDLCSRLRRQ